MPTVTVDAADLETLLFFASGVKDLESALDQRRRNPMVTGAKGKMEAAHDRLSTACRRAKRDADWPARFVNEADIAELRAMFIGRDGQMQRVAVLTEYPMHFAQDLLLVEAGPIWHGYRIEWPSPAEPEFRMEQQGYATCYGARLTFYGLQVLGLQESDLQRADHTMGGFSASARQSGMRSIGDIVQPIVQRAIGSTPQD